MEPEVGIPGPRSFDALAGGVAHEVAIEAAPGVVLRGELTVPSGACSRVVIAFADGLGPSRPSSHNRHVAGVLNEAGMATLLLDLLTPLERTCRIKVFDLELLGRRLIAAAGWLRRRPETAGLAVDYSPLRSYPGRESLSDADARAVAPADGASA
ncbi:MAG TPA: hypothetical protein VES97_05360 [Solirubrobacteraceae bacterium]|nr:hypothetical protein [Solirubrobacteraceae bacterium]HYM67643.1 hypothetical protein [Patescibacteria group bacterium]